MADVQFYVVVGEDLDFIEFDTLFHRKKFQSFNNQIEDETDKVQMQRKLINENFHYFVKYCEEITRG